MLPGLLLFMALAAPGIQNPGFEAAQLLSGWEVNTPAQGTEVVQVRADTTDRKEGRQSLLIEARAPASYSLNQWSCFRRVRFGGRESGSRRKTWATRGGEAGAGSL